MSEMYFKLNLAFQIRIHCFLEKVFGRFLSPTSSDFKKKSCAESRSSRHNLEYPHDILSNTFYGDNFLDSAYFLNFQTKFLKK